jgi:hypothetical protein
MERLAAIGFRDHPIYRRREFFRGAREAMTSNPFGEVPADRSVGMESEGRSMLGELSEPGHEKMGCTILVSLMWVG